MSIDTQPIHVETISLRALIKTVISRWKLILILMVIGGLITSAVYFLRKPVYTATTVVSIDPSVLTGNTTPTFIISGDEIKEEVAENFNLDLLSLPAVTVITDKADKSISSISLESKNQQLAIEMANFWGKTAVSWILENMNQSTDLEAATKEVNAVTSELNNYLQSHNLGDLSWYELILITGVSTPESISLSSLTKDLPPVTAKQRIELSEILRKKEAAEWNYSIISQDILSNQYQANLRVRVVNKAIEAEDTSILGSIIMIPLGLFIGLLIALIWIFMEDWWKHEEQINGKLSS